MSKLPEDFDWKIYLELNSDVRQDTETKSGAIQHYLTYGIKENRVYSKKTLPNDFDWKEYLKLNPDVKKDHFTKHEAINHYIRYGIKENRKYKNVQYDVEDDNNLIEEMVEEDFEANIDDDEWNSGEDEDLMEIYAIRSLDNQESLEDDEDNK
jgi:hypothetical protein